MAPCVRLNAKASGFKVEQEIGVQSSKRLGVVFSFFGSRGFFGGFLTSPKPLSEVIPRFRNLELVKRAKPLALEPRKPSRGKLRASRLPATPSLQTAASRPICLLGSGTCGDV